jgi:hypothetical protein
MIKEYINKIIKNLPDKIIKRKTPEIIDVIFDGGLFNGSYLVGVAYFLKEMEKNSYIKVRKISCCSIGSFVALLYVTDCLDLFESSYEFLIQQLKTNHLLNETEKLFYKIKPLLPENICEKMNNKVYINYYNVKKSKSIVKQNYKDLNDIFDTIMKSSFVPLLINGNLFYKKKYIDGLNPYIFPIEKEVKILYVDLHGGFDKILGTFNVKNEKTNFHRIITGVLDIHNFYIKECRTEFCSYVDEWSYMHKSYNHTKTLLEIFFVKVINIVYNLKKNIPKCYYEDNILFILISKILKEIYIIILEKYLI